MVSFIHSFIKNETEAVKKREPDGYLLYLETLNQSERVVD